MPKEMKSIPEGNLLSVASTKGYTTLSALKEKTGVDRKTLRSINAGQPVKQTTLQSIADKLRIPIAHLLASNSGNKNQNHSSSSDKTQFGEIKLQRLDRAGTYVFWDKIRLHKDMKLLPVLRYFSDLRAALKITSEDKISPTVRVGIGWVPPREFVESELRGIDFVEVDSTQVWSRENNFDEGRTTSGESNAQ
jgi:hypothetical protein